MKWKDTLGLVPDRDNKIYIFTDSSREIAKLNFLHFPRSGRQQLHNAAEIA